MSKVWNGRCNCIRSFLLKIKTIFVFSSVFLGRGRGEVIVMRIRPVVSNTTTSFQQGQSQSTTARQNRSPPEQPNQPGVGAKRWLFVACFRLCSLAREALSFRRPPSSRFASQNHESGSPMATSQFGVNSFLASSGAPPEQPHRRRRWPGWGVPSLFNRDHNGAHGKLGSTE